MKRLIEFFARQGLFSELITVLVIGVGLFTLFKINRETFPNVQYDIITVNTVFPGSASSEVEKLITNPLEQELKEVDGIKKMFSVSMEGLSYIIIQLDPDQVSQEEAKVDVQDVVDRFKDLPEQAEDPIITALESKIFPVVEVGVSGGTDPFELKEVARYIEEEIETMPEVARVDRKGEQEYEVRVEISAQKLKEYQLSFTEVIRALKEQNVSIPGGDFTRLQEGIEKDVIVRTDGQFDDVDGVKKTVIRSNDLGSPIVLGDIANVYMSLKEIQITHRVNGDPAIRLVVMKKEKADAIALIDNLKKLINERLDQEKIKNVHLEYVNDMSFLIRRRLGVLSNNMLVGLVLVVVMLSIFLPVRVSLVTAIGIPFSFLGTMWFFYSNGVSLNLITMMGLIIVVGMLVDDAIVVTENAVRHMEEGNDPMTGAIKATQQIWAAVFASVMTTVLAFFPMAIMSGIFGKFVSYIPIGVICALLISLLECYFILPYHIGRWVRLKDVAKPEKGFKAAFDKMWVRLIASYGVVLEWITCFRYLVFAGFIAFLFISVLNIKHNMRLVLFPPKGIDQFLVKVKAPNGTSLEQTTELLKPIEKVIGTLSKEELRNFVTSVGEQRQRPDEPGDRGSHVGQVMVYLTPESGRERSAEEIIEDIRGKVKVSDQLKVIFNQINPGPPVGAPVNVGVRGENYERIMLLVNEITDELKDYDGVKDLSHNFSKGKEQLIVRVNPKESLSVGLSAATVGTSVMAAFEGVIATSIKSLDDEIDIRVTLPKAEQKGRAGIAGLQVLNPFGKLVRLDQIADFESEQGIESYFHVNNKRQVNVNGEVDVTKTSATEVSNYIRGKVEEYRKKYPDLSLDFGGEDEDTKESLDSLKRAFILALVLIYFLLILTFQSFVWPLIIVLVIPIGAVSVAWALFFHGQPLSFMGMLGVVALAGVIVNNAIVFVDFVMKEREEGIDGHQSIILAGQKRLRPILLTTLTTVCGILPTAYGIGGMDPFVVPIALSLGWGMFLGSGLASFFLPAFVAIFDDIRSLGRRA
ncbi:MAG: efflux RND transporter permease subunit [Bdellovibrionales bacterium]|nr:efflux RND transporter permease subunit [Bdellovibrionales bacterium]